MTFGIFIVLVLGLFIAILNFLPIATALPVGLTSGILLIIGYMKEWNFLFPISEIFIAFGIVVLYEIAVWFMHVLFRVVRLIRGHSDGA